MRFGDLHACVVSHPFIDRFDKVARGKMGQLGKMGHLTNDSFFVKLKSGVKSIKAV